MPALIIAALVWLAFKPAPEVDIRPADANPLAPAEYNFEIRNAGGDVFTIGPYKEADRLPFRSSAPAKGWTILRELRV